MPKIMLLDNRDITYDISDDQWLKIKKLGRNKDFKLGSKILNTSNVGKVIYQEKEQLSLSDVVHNRAKSLGKKCICKKCR